VVVAVEKRGDERPGVVCVCSWESNGRIDCMDYLGGSSWRRREVAEGAL